MAHLPSGTLAVNGYTELEDVGAILDQYGVKVVVADRGEALMFSRHSIPSPRDDRPKYLGHLGLYGLTGMALRRIRQLRQGPLERAEGVEMLRFVEHGHAVRLTPAADNGVTVDSPEDLVRAEASLPSRPGPRDARFPAPSRLLPDSQARGIAGAKPVDSVP